MLSTAAGVPTAPAGVAGDFLAALTAALAPSSPSAPDVVAPAPPQSSDSTVAAGVSAQTSVLVPQATVTPMPTTPATACAATAPIGQPSLADGAAPNVAADPTTGTSTSTSVPSASTAAAVVVAPVVDGNLGAVPTSSDTSPTVTSVPVVHPTQRLAAAARRWPLAARENLTGSAAETSPHTSVSPESADPATPPRPTARRAPQPDLATGSAVPPVPPSAVSVAVGGAVGAASAAGLASNTPADAASAVDGSQPAIAVRVDDVPPGRAASDAQAAAAITIPVTTASQQAVAALVAGPARVGQSRRPSSSSDSDAAPGSAATATNPLVGHRADVATNSTAPTATAGPRVAADTVPAGLGMVGTDRVAKVREQVAGRPMQRLSIELDDARVAIRVRGDKVSVDVTSDPKGALGEGWARQVERTIDRAVRTQESEPRGSSPDRQAGSNGRGQQQPSQRQRHGQGQGQRQGQQFEIGSWNFEPNVEPHFEERS
jgi:hypothetical protein